MTLHGLLKRLWSLQPDINAVRDAWDALPADLFESAGEKLEFESAATYKEVFGLLVQAHHSGNWNSAVFDAHRRLERQRNHRAVVIEWTKAAGAALTRLPKYRQITQYNLDAGEAEPQINLHSPAARARIYENVMKQARSYIWSLRQRRRKPRSPVRHAIGKSAIATRRRRPGLRS